MKLGHGGREGEDKGRQILKGSIHPYPVDRLIRQKQPSCFIAFCSLVNRAFFVDFLFHCFPRSVLINRLVYAFSISLVRAPERFNSGYC